MSVDTDVAPLKGASSLPEAVVATQKPAAIPEETPAGYELAAATSALALYVTEDGMRIAVLDRNAGRLWTSAVDGTTLSRKPNKLWSANITSPFTFSYQAVDNTKGNTKTGNATNEVTAAKVTRLTDGVSIHYTMRKLRLELTMELRLDGGSLVACIPEDELVEGEKNYFVSIELLPFLGATVDTDEGYYLYPNGPGELYYFKDEALRQNALKTYTIPYYSAQTVNIGAIEQNDEEHTEIQAMLPAYGIKVGDAGLVAMVEDGAPYTALTISPSGVSVTCNRIFNSFVYRKSYGVYGSSVSIAGGSSVFPLAVLLDKERYAGDRVVRYTFLSKDEADYSGMANVVRQRYLDTGLLPSTPVAGVAPTVLDLLGGITEETLFFETYKKLTTFAQSEEIVTDLKTAGVDSLVINLKGWADGGLTASPQKAKAANKLGGYRGLKSLATLCAEQKIPLYLHANYTDIYAGSGSYNLNTDAARDPNNYMYTNGDETHFLQGPHVALHKQSELLAYLQDLPLAGLTFARLGTLVYSDHYNKNPCMADRTAAAWVKMLNTTADAFGSVAVEGGNGYVLTEASLLRDVPEKSVSVLFGDETVPFYHMIVHGSVYYTGTQNNLFYDTKAQTLKMIEYGYLPYYELTYAPSKELRNTAYSTLFSCNYADWRDSIVTTSQVFSGQLAALYGCYMTGHEAVAEDVVCVTYSNGAQVYINYRDTAYEANSVRVEAESYVVVTKGG
ncbi:MAG: hypothetical protein IJ518_03570 [Clostridia bacterium]|nr:hypothetical protein [Clostridia bacterium]